MFSIFNKAALGLLLAACYAAACAEPPVDCHSTSSNPVAPHICKVDPPNWWVGLPAPMLLIQGEGLRGASFSLSDPALRVEKTVISGNGHWAQLWLSAEPQNPETVTLRVTHGKSVLEWPYTFSARRAAPGGFSSRDVIYLLMPDRFADGNSANDGSHAADTVQSESAKAERDKPRGWHGGDLRGVLDHLDYLQQLGVTAIWMTPIDQNLGAESYHGYHATDMYSVDPHFGSMDDLRELSQALHHRGMKLVLDTVPNHVGPLHPWVTDEPMPDWFHGTAEHHLAGETNFSALIDPHAPEAAREGTLKGWFVDQLPDMNTENPAVAKYLRQNAEWWIEEAGVDALRIDTFPYVDRPFWNQYLGELEGLYPKLTEVGEVANGDPVIVSSFAGGVTRAGVDTKLYTPFDFPTFFALRAALRDGESLKKVAATLAEDSLYPHPERLVLFFDNHDNSRFLDGGRSLEAMKLAYAFVMTTRGTPQLYYGDEIGMRGGEDPENRHDFPGGFADSKKDAFKAEGRTPDQEEMFSWGVKLGQLRHEHAALTCGGEQVLSAGDDWLVYLRDTTHRAEPACAAGKGERLMVAIHRGEKNRSLDVKLAGTWMEGCRLSAPMLSSASSTANIEQDLLRLNAATDDVVMASCH